MKITRAVCWVALILACSCMVWADPVSGTLFYTTFQGGNNVHKVDFNYDGTTFTLGPRIDIAATNGADGLLFAPDGNLLVAGQGFNLTEVSTGGAIVKTVNPGNPSFHLALNGDGSLVYSLWNGGGGAPIGASPLIGGGLSTNGTPYSVSCAPGTACSTDVRGVILDTTNNTWYYGTAFDGDINGQFGSVVFDDILHTAVLTPILFDVPAHGLTFDPFTNDIIFSSQNVIDQFNPVTGTIVSTLNGPGNFDQSAVDGKGHLFVASNSGFLEFADYRATGLIGTPTFTASPFLAPALDDIAPLSGLGGGGQVPEPSSILLFGTALAVVGYRLRKRAA